VQLQRVDETIASPLTNIQQVVSRGNPAWSWTYEFTNLSLEEREVVQAFLMNCRGSLNTFKVSDPGDYQIRGSLSDWTDVFSGYGSFNTVVGSTTTKINSWFGKVGNFASHITDERTVKYSVRRRYSAIAMEWAGHGTAGPVNSLESGLAYLHRVKYFTNDRVNGINFSVGSGGGTNLIQDTARVYSSGVISAPFISHNSSYDVAVIAYPQGSEAIGNTFELTDYSLQRCALIVKSENLFTYSNSFGASDWGKTGCDVVHNTLDDPLGGNHTWRWYVNSDDGASLHYLSFANVTKANTTDIYTVGIHGRVGNGFDCLRLQFSEGAGGNYCYVDYDLSVNSVYNVIRAGTFTRVHGKIWDVNSGYFRVQMTGLVSSHSTLEVRIYAINSQGGGITYSAVDTTYMEIVGASMVKFPFLKPYYETGATEIVGTGTLTGSRVYFEGFDAEDIIKAGTRMEIITGYHDDANDLYERSEFKRITKEVRASLDGHALIEFDPPIRNNPIHAITVPAGNGDEETMHNAVVFHKPEMKASLLNGTIQYIDKQLQMNDIVFDVLEDLTE
jgi:hypothetical protein